MNQPTKRTRARMLNCSVWIWCLLASVLAAQTVTQPAADETIQAAEDFATTAFQDPWDMNQRTDPGWSIFNTVQQPLSSLSGISFSGGIFSATSTSADPNIFLLESAIPGTILDGKTGANFPIDAATYRVLALRLYLPSASQAQVFFSKGTIYSTNYSTSLVDVSPGWGVYFFDLASLASPNWSGTVDSLRLDPTQLSGQAIQLDWVRLVQPDAGLHRTVQWSGFTGAVDLFLDDDTDFANGTLGKVTSGAASSGTYDLFVGALAPGLYRVAVRPSSGGTAVYAPGAYRVNDIPTVTFTNPSDEGSDDDFATTELGNPWDMDALADVDRTENITGATILTNVAAEDESGTSPGTPRLFKGTSVATTGNGDPLLFLLGAWGRGVAHPIDTERYRILTLRWGLPGARDVEHGSIGRIVWGNDLQGGDSEIVSRDIVINSKAGTLVIDRLIFDMKEMFVEPRSDDPPRTNYQGVLHSFRLDPHEFSAATNFYIQNVKLAAFERADDSYTVRWTYSDAFAPGTATLALYRDADRQGFDGTQIASGLDPASGSTVWNTSGLAGGTYYLYAVVSDGTNGNRAYARWPVVIDHRDQLTLSHATLNYAKVGTAVTAGQTLRITSSGGAIAWTAAAATANGKPWITLSATSGTTPATLQIGVDPTGLTTGTYTGTVTIGSAGASNSPLSVAVTLRVMNRSGVPWGNFDTPTNGATGIAGSIAVTGWALDDVEVIAIKLYRDPQAGEPTQPNGKVYIGDANLVEGARPDVEALYPEAPWNYRAGWGYMLLTNFLPYSGNGTFRIYAYISDRDGHATLLGSKQITCDNANAVSPFGTIDTPEQGGGISGSSYVNFGWALSPQPGTIPTDGSTIWVWVDGVPLGHPVYNQPRADIDSLFPGYANTGGAVGYYYLDPSSLAEGVHTIAWSVRDDQGRENGIGSRYFSVAHDAGGTGAKMASARVLPENAGDHAPSSRPLPVVEAIEDDLRPLRVTWSFAAREETLAPGAGGELMLEALVGAPISLQLDPALAGPPATQANARERRVFWGRQRVGAALRPLPAGSHLDPQTGVFSWLPGPGFAGVFSLEFFQRVDSVTILRRRVAVRVVVPGS